MFITRLEKSAGIVSNARKPPQTTRSTDSARQSEKIASLNSATLANDFRWMTSHLNPASVARAMPPQSGRLAMTSGMTAGNVPAVIFATRFVSVVPPPEIKTAKRIGRSRGAQSGRWAVMKPRRTVKGRVRQ